MRPNLPELHDAVRTRNVARVRGLLNGLPPERLTAVMREVDGNRYTPLHVAANEGGAELVRVLAELAPNEFRTGVSAIDEDGNTPLMFASSGETVRALAAALTPDEFKATVNVLNARRDTPLHYASADKVRALAELAPDEAKAIVNAVDEDGNTPLHLAFYSVVQATGEAIIELVRLGSDVRLANREGNTALHFAAKNIDILETSVITLIQLGALIGAVNAEGNTPLQVARASLLDAFNSDNGYWIEKTKTLSAILIIADALKVLPGAPPSPEERLPRLHCFRDLFTFANDQNEAREGPTYDYNDIDFRLQAALHEVLSGRLSIDDVPLDVLPGAGAPQGRRENILRFRLVGDDNPLHVVTITDGYDDLRIAKSLRKIRAIALVYGVATAGTTLLPGPLHAAAAAAPQAAVASPENPIVGVLLDNETEFYAATELFRKLLVDDDSAPLIQEVFTRCAAEQPYTLDGLCESFVQAAQYACGIWPLYKALNPSAEICDPISRQQAEDVCRSLTLRSQGLVTGSNPDDRIDLNVTNLITSYITTPITPVINSLEIISKVLPIAKAFCQEWQTIGLVTLLPAQPPLAPEYAAAPKLQSAARFALDGFGRRVPAVAAIEPEAAPAAEAMDVAAGRVAHRRTRDEAELDDHPPRAQRPRIPGRAVRADTSDEDAPGGAVAGAAAAGVQPPRSPSTPRR